MNAYAFPNFPPTKISWCYLCALTHLVVIIDEVSSVDMVILTVFHFKAGSIWWFYFNAYLVIITNSILKLSDCNKRCCINHQPCSWNEPHCWLRALTLAKDHDQVHILIETKIWCYYILWRFQLHIRRVKIFHRRNNARNLCAFSNIIDFHRDHNFSRSDMPFKYVMNCLLSYIVFLVMKENCLHDLVKHSLRGCWK